MTASAVVSPAGSQKGPGFLHDLLVPETVLASSPHMHVFLINDSKAILENGWL